MYKQSKNHVYNNHWHLQLCYRQNFTVSYNLNILSKIVKSLFVKQLRSPIHHVLSATSYSIYLLYHEDSHIQIPLQNIILEHGESTYQECRILEDAWEKSTIQGRKLYIHILTKRTKIISRCFCCFIPVTYFL